MTTSRSRIMGQKLLSRVPCTDMHSMMSFYVCSRAADLGSAEKAVTRKLVQQAISNAVQSDGRSLGEVSPTLLQPAQGLPCQESCGQQHARA